MRRSGLLSFITALFVLGWFLNAWSDAQEEREKYRERAGEKIEKLEGEIEHLKARGEDLKGEEGREFNDQMTLLRDRVKVAKEKYHEIRRQVKTASASTWDIMMSEMDAALRDAEDAHDRAESRLRELKGK